MAGFIVFISTGKTVILIKNTTEQSGGSSVKSVHNKIPLQEPPCTEEEGIPSQTHRKDDRPTTRSEGVQSGTVSGPEVTRDTQTPD